MNRIPLEYREIAAIELIAESLQSIAASLCKIVTLVEEDIKEEQAFKLVNERRNSNLF
jgi:hypothetical protein